MTVTLNVTQPLVAARSRYPVTFWGPTILYDLDAPPIGASNPLAMGKDRGPLFELLDLALDLPLRNLGTLDAPAWHYVNEPLRRYLERWGPVWQHNEAHFPIASRTVRPPTWSDPAAPPTATLPDGQVVAFELPPWNAWVDFAGPAHEGGHFEYERVRTIVPPAREAPTGPLRMPPVALRRQPRWLLDDVIALQGLQKELRWAAETARVSRAATAGGARQVTLAVQAPEAQDRATARLREIIDAHIGWLQPRLAGDARTGYRIELSAYSLVPFLYLHVARYLPGMQSWLGSGQLATCEADGRLFDATARERYCSDSCATRIRVRKHREARREGRTNLVGADRGNRSIGTD